MNVAAIVLCGGRSRRMGRPKASLPFGGETLLERVIRVLGTVTGTIVVVAAPVEAQPIVQLPPGVFLVRDPAPGLGPLRGIATGLSSLPEAVDLVYVSAVDAPFLNPSWVEYLASQIGDDDIALPFAAGHHHPLSAMYRPSRVLPMAGRLLASGRFRVLDLMDSLRCRVISEAEMARVDPGLATLRNLNTPEDYLAALIDAGIV